MGEISKLKLIDRIINDLEKLKLCIDDRRDNVFGDLNERTKQILLSNIVYLKLSSRSYNVIKKFIKEYCNSSEKYPHLTEISYIGELVQIEERHLVRVPGCGRKSINEIKLALENVNLELGMYLPNLTSNFIKTLDKSLLDNFNS